jgi:predicted pyridoxine 5'-phosphate oxidase superfamily flavin-nucleotide-binding protein
MIDLGKAVSLYQRVERVLVATANAEGQPHIAVAGKLALEAGGQMVVTEWFCPTTMANVGENRAIALVVWDRLSDVGYQIIGQVERVDESAFADGYLPGEEVQPIPQVQRELWIKVHRMLAFTEGPHTDQSE